MKDTTASLAPTEWSVALSGGNRDGDSGPGVGSMFTVAQDGWVGSTMFVGGVRLIVGVTEAGEHADANKQRRKSAEIIFRIG
ncbi:MAG TPA: hypothetical protein PLA27_07680 [Anaerolineales bacterium]|nr:hypothetical protein [Anaerolineales bacterium]HQX16289.1 hypothetical protein [Anaerolineales bacterium]